MRFLIDGYNLIFECGLMERNPGSLALEKARHRLVRELLAKLPVSSRSQTMIVFDAANRPVKEVPDAEEVEGIRIVYAVGHDEADSLIEEMIRKHSSPKQLTVVSSDHRIQEAARRRKAIPVDSDHWFDRLDSSPSDSLSGDNLEGNDWEEKRADELGDYNPFPPGYGDDLRMDD